MAVAVGNRKRRQLTAAADCQPQRTGAPEPTPMPHNPHRGEIEARLDGAPYRLCLTLGALAELESAFGDTDMLALAERFERGRLSAREAQRIIAAGLRGAGHDIADEARSAHAGRRRRRRLRRHRRPPARRHLRRRSPIARTRCSGAAGKRDPTAIVAPRPRRDAPPPPLSLARRDGRRPRPPAPPAGRTSGP